MTKKLYAPLDSNLSQDRAKRAGSRKNRSESAARATFGYFSLRCARIAAHTLYEDCFASPGTFRTSKLSVVKRADDLPEAEK
jgi:hypothetical protein